ncbi:MAG TPA: hypothetical protein VMM85_03215 [Methylomirabilota bacterium]|nr:hypothetical protein [Methylomirabilota bacterium]
MLSPNHITFGLAHKAREERLRHGERIHFVSRDRGAEAKPVSRVTFRRMLAHRLAER